jgi:hypothetical protein
MARSERFELPTLRFEEFEIDGARGHYPSFADRLSRLFIPTDSFQTTKHAGPFLALNMPPNWVPKGTPQGAREFRVEGTLETSMALDTRHRDKNGEISRKHGDTIIRTLRMTYGPGFAEGCRDDEKLSGVLHKLDETSLSHLIRDHEAGYLNQICRAA